MKKMVKNKVFGWALAVAMLLVFSSHSQAWIKFNGVESSFDFDGREAIEELVIDGASSFLQSYSRLLVVFRQLEQQRLQAVNIPALLGMLDELIPEMEKARGVYLNLYQKALNTPYDPAAIDRLRALDYDRFRPASTPDETGESAVIRHLEQGDVRAVLCSGWLECETILDDLSIFRHILENGSLPGVEFLWKLNQACLNSLAGGQMAARIFHLATGK